MRTEAMHVVLGSDRPVPVGPIVHQTPRPKPTGLDWAAISPPPPPVEQRPTPPRGPRVRKPRAPGSMRNEPSRVKPGPHTGRAAYVDRITARLTALGVRSGDIRDWADKNGVPYNPRGLIREDVIDAYEDAHPREKGTAA